MLRVCRSARDILFGYEDELLYGLNPVVRHSMFGYCCRTLRCLNPVLRVCRSARDILFGYEDELLRSVSRWVPSLRKRVHVELVKNETSVEQALAEPRTRMHTGTLFAKKCIGKLCRYSGPS